MSRLTRRELLKGTLAIGGAAAGFGLPASKAFGRILGANDDIRVGVIGLRVRGREHLKVLSGVKGMVLAGLCDVDPALLGEATALVTKSGGKVQTFNDPRAMLDSKEIDVVTVATPNHWHSLLGIWACQAGKDAYVEKPVSHDVWEGRKLVTAARKHQRIIQAGTQGRAAPNVIAAVQWMQEGNLGKIKYAKVVCYKARLPIGKVGHGEIPPGLDYDLWTGPAPMKPLQRQNLHYDWHWFYDYGNGDLGNTAVHEIDLARWTLGYDAAAPRVMSVGARVGVDDDGETPNTHMICYDYPGAPILCEVRGLPRSKECQTRKLWGRSMDVPEGFLKPWGVGLVVVAEGGRLIMEGESIRALDPQGKVIKEFQQDGQNGIAYDEVTVDNFRSWQKAIRSRKLTDQASEILQCHISSAMCHLALISHRLGSVQSKEEILQQIKGTAAASDCFEAMKGHLDRNGVDMQKPQLTLGPWLEFDAAAERFVNNEAANAMLRGQYRAPFVVPEIV